MQMLYMTARTWNFHQAVFLLSITLLYRPVGGGTVGENLSCFSSSSCWVPTEGFFSSTLEEILVAPVGFMIVLSSVLPGVPPRD